MDVYGSEKKKSPKGIILILNCGEINVKRDEEGKEICELSEDLDFDNHDLYIQPYGGKYDSCLV